MRLVECFKPLLLHLLSLELSRKTLRTHRDNLWILGGKIIYHRTSEEQQRSFDSTCRRFYRFLQAYQTQPH